MDADFQKAADEAKKFSKKPTDKELLELYGLYKQATAGDCNTDRPGMLDLKGKAKWDAWNERKGTTQEKAKEEYIGVVERIKGEYK